MEPEESFSYLYEEERKDYIENSLGRGIRRKWVEKDHWLPKILHSMQFKNDFLIISLPQRAEFVFH